METFLKLRDKSLIEIRLSKFTLTFVLNDNTKILSCDNCYIINSGNITARWNYQSSGHNLEEFINILEQQITKVEFDESIGLELMFDKLTLMIPNPNDNVGEYLQIFSEELGVFIF